MKMAQLLRETERKHNHEYDFAGSHVAYLTLAISPTFLALLFVHSLTG